VKNQSRRRRSQQHASPFDRNFQGGIATALGWGVVAVLVYTLFGKNLAEIAGL
jgi:hypothetical protein